MLVAVLESCAMCRVAVGHTAIPRSPLCSECQVGFYCFIYGPSNRHPCLTGIQRKEISLEKQQVTVETSLPTQTVQDALASTGLDVNVRGAGAHTGPSSQRRQAYVVAFLWCDHPGVLN